jgi:hypothetical protein
MRSGSDDQQSLGHSQEDRHVTVEEIKAALRTHDQELEARVAAAENKLGLSRTPPPPAPAKGVRMRPPPRDDYAVARESACPEQRPHGGLSIDDVAFGVLTSERFLETRLASQQRTWLRRVRHVVFYSETMVASLPTVALSPPPKEDLVGGGAWKNLPALVDLHLRYPRKKWIFFNDDDTYVFVDNLLTVLGGHDPDRDFYLGLYWTPRVDMEWKEVQIAYASGGAGYALSRSMMQRLGPVMGECHTKYTRWAGDIRVGKCVHDLGVRITPGIGFHHEAHDMYAWDSSGGGFPYGHLSKRASAATLAPATFHHLTVDQMNLYARMQIAERRGPNGELYRWDFGRFFLKEYIGFSPALNHRFRLLFGISVEVADHFSGVPFNAGGRWRKDFSDPLYVHALNTDGSPQPTSSGAAFEMAIAKSPEIFNGDGCDAHVDNPRRVPPRKSAIIQIRCQPCVPVGAPAATKAEYGRICGIRRDDACTIAIELSLDCPPRELVYAPTLDVGTTRGGSELVAAGAPTSCSSRPEGSDQPARPPMGSSSEPLSVSLTHGSLLFAPAAVSVDAAGCTASVEGESAAVDGGEQRAVDGAQELRVLCRCHQRSKRLMANLTLSLRTLDFTPPTLVFAHRCSASPA